MTDKVLVEIEKFFENNQDDVQLYIDIFQRLDLDSQFQLIDAIKYLIIEEGLETPQAITQVFNNILQQMR